MPKNGKIADPHAEREASRYDNPIPSRELIMEVLTEAKKPLNHNKLAKKLELGSDEQLDALGKRPENVEAARPRHASESHC